MPRMMNHEWELAKLRREIQDARLRDENVEVMEACLRLGEAIMDYKPTSYIEKTLPAESE